jgi:hypothetical protein
MAINPKSGGLSALDPQDDTVDPQNEEFDYGSDTPDLRSYLASRVKDRADAVAALPKWEEYTAALGEARQPRSNLSQISEALLAYGKPLERGQSKWQALGNAATTLTKGIEAEDAAKRAEQAKRSQLKMQYLKAKSDVAAPYDEAIDRLAIEAFKAPKLPGLVPVAYDKNGLALNPFTGQKPPPGIVGYTRTGEGLTQEQMDNLYARYSPPAYGAKPAPPATGVAGQPVSSAATLIAAPPQKDSSTYKQVTTRAEAWALPPGYTAVLPDGKEFTRTTTGLEEVKGVDADTSVQDEADARALAAELYIPYTPAPIPTFKTASKRDEYVKGVAEKGARTLADLEEDGRDAASLASKAKQFMATNEQVITNPVTGNVPAALQSEEMQKLNAIAKDLIAFVPRTPGAQSNFDAVNLGKSTLSPTNPKEVNDAIGRRYIAYDQLNYENQQFLNDWRSVHSGSTQGAEVAWKRYLRENPVFDPKQPDKAILNKGRLQYKDWAKRTYYGEKAPAAASAQAPASSPKADKQITKTIGGVTYVKFGPGPNDWAAK